MTKVQREKTRASSLDLTRVLQDEVVVHSELLPSQAKMTENRGSRPKRFNLKSAAPLFKQYLLIEPARPARRL